MKYFGDDNYIAAGDMSGNVIGDALDVRETKTQSFVATWTGTTPVGFLNVEVSNDGGTTWAELSSDAVAGDTGSLVKTVGDIGWGFTRMSFIFTSGVGTLEVNSGIKVDDIR